MMRRNSTGGAYPITNSVLGKTSSGFLLVGQRQQPYQNESCISTKSKKICLLACLTFDPVPDIIGKLKRFKHHVCAGVLWAGKEEQYIVIGHYSDLPKGTRKVGRGKQYLII